MIETIQIKDFYGIWTFDVGPITSTVNPGWLVCKKHESDEYCLVDSKGINWALSDLSEYLQIYWTDKKDLTFVERQTLFFDMDGVLCDFEVAALKLLADKGFLRKNFISTTFKQMISDCQDVPGFYRNLPPIPGAIEAFKTLSQYYDCYICSAPSWTNPSSWTDKQLWVLEHLGEEYAYKKLILTHNKGMFSGRALIDDRVKYNVPNFKGEHIMFGTGIFNKGWDSIVKYLLPHKIDNSIIDPTTNLVSLKLKGSEYDVYTETASHEVIVLLSLLIHFESISIENLTTQVFGRWTPQNESGVHRLIKIQNRITTGFIGRYLKDSEIAIKDGIVSLVKKPTQQ